jgi:hypothetical protein
MAFDPTYYDRVDSSLTFAAATIASGLSSSFLIVDSGSVPMQQRRRLSASNYQANGQTLALIYHTSEFADLIPTREGLLEAACRTEHLVRLHLTCLVNSSVKSALPLLMNATCNRMGWAATSLAQARLSNYFADGITSARPNSSILISYFESRSCELESNSQIAAQIAALNPTAERLEITVVNTALLRADVSGAYVAALTISGYLTLIGAAGVIWGYGGLAVSLALLW